MNANGMERTRRCSELKTTQRKSDYPQNAIDLLPNFRNSVTNAINDQTLERDYQNVHPILPWYKHDLDTGKLSHENLVRLLNKDNEVEFNASWLTMSIL